jgi:hypothetical protein
MFVLNNFLDNDIKFFGIILNRIYLLNYILILDVIYVLYDNVLKTSKMIMYVVYLYKHDFILNNSFLAIK